METVKSLVLCLQVFSQNEAAKYSGVSLDQIWEHSLNVARIAREITLFQTGDPLQANEAFTAGLLHDVGRIVMASNLPKEYVETVKAAKEQARPLHVQEAAQFGVHHAQVGAYLLVCGACPQHLLKRLPCIMPPAARRLTNFRCSRPSMWLMFCPRER